MTPSEIRQARRIRREWIRFVVHMAILIVFGLLILGNQHSIMVMQTDTLDRLTLMDLDSEMDRLAPNPYDGWDKDVIEPEQADPISYQLTPDERDLVCRVVAAEARGEDLQGQMAVANVILDRAVLWDIPVTEVVTAPGQFARPYQGEISDETRLAVADVFDGGVRVFAEPVTHFAEGEPYWAEGKVARGSIGVHRFWY